MLSYLLIVDKSKELHRTNLNIFPKLKAFMYKVNFSEFAMEADRRALVCCAEIELVSLFCYANHFCRFTLSIIFAKLEVQKQL